MDYREGRRNFSNTIRHFPFFAVVSTDAPSMNRLLTKARVTQWSDTIARSTYCEMNISKNTIWQNNSWQNNSWQNNSWQNNSWHITLTTQ